MKGKLYIKDNGLQFVQYHIINSIRSLPLHRDSVRLLSLRSDKQPEHMHMEEVDFEIVKQYTDSNTNQVQRYAKLTRCNGLNFEKPTELIDDRQAYLETLVKVLAKTWFYGDWKWETPNERVMHFIMVELGLYPFFTEDDMIEKTQVSEDYYKLASKYVLSRAPESKPYAPEDLIGFAKWIGADWMSIWVENKMMWEYQNEVGPPHKYLGYYTDEQLFELYLADKNG
jgi:hypothetical protein